MMSAVLSGLKVALPSFSGRSEEFEDFQFALRAYMGRHNLVEKLDARSLSASESKDVYYVITTALSGDAISTIREVAEGDGKAAYRVLCDRCASSRVAAKYALLRKLMGTKCPNMEELENWLTDMSNAKRRLENLEVSWEEVLVLSTIDNLPQELKPVGDWCLAAEQITFHQLKRVLMEKKDACERGEYQSAKVMTAAAPQRKPTCMYCGEEGHWAAKCPGRKTEMPERKAEKMVSKYAGPVCYRCKRPGHMMRDCRVRTQIAGASVAQLLCAPTEE